MNLKNKCKVLFLSFFLLWINSSAQTGSRMQSLDSTTIMRIAKKNKLFRQCKQCQMPTIRFDSVLNTWQIVIIKYSFTRKGKCKYTNGCTIQEKRIIWVDAKMKKVVKRKKEIEIYANYE
jgi:hypothetical protein